MSFPWVSFSPGSLPPVSFPGRRFGIGFAVTGVVVFALVGGVTNVAFAAPPTAPTTVGVTGQRSSATRLSFPVSDQVSASVDVGTGNLLVATRAVSLPGVNGSVPVGSAYNSRSTNAGAVGTRQANGWVWSLDGAGSLAVSGSGGTLVLVGADGSATPFTRSATDSYLATSGELKASLVTNHSGQPVTGYTLTYLTSGTIVQFDADGTPISVTDRNGNIVTIGTAYADPLSVTTYAGPTAARKATIAYSAATYTTTVSQTNGASTRSVKYVKNASSNLTSMVDAVGNTTSFGYTGTKLTSIISPTGQSTTISYDASGKVSQVDRGNTSTGSPGTSTTRLTYPSPTQTLVAGPNTSIGVAVATGDHSTYSINAATFLVQGVTDAAGRVRSATYTPNADVATATTGTGTGSGTTTGTYGANNGQSVTAVQAPGGATSTAAYANTAPSSQYLPSSTSNDAGNGTTFTYNGTGNPLSSQNTALAATATVTVNTDGTVSTATAPGNGANSTGYTYNSDHQLGSVTPVTGGSLGVRTFSYDPFGRVSTTTDGRGITLTYSYDKINRLLTTTFSNGTPTVTNSYDNAGRITTRTDGLGTTSYGYDQLGRLTSRQNSVGGGVISYGYDRASNLVSTTDTRGTTTNAFDASGVPTSITYAHNASTQVLGIATDSRGRRTDQWLQTDPGHTVWAAHTHNDYDTSGRVSRTIGQVGPSNTSNTTVLDVSYCYNSATPAPTCGTGTTTDRSKLQWSKDNLTGQTTTYSYDGAGRLTGVVQSGGTGANSYAYTYDSRGNRLTAVVTGATPSSQTFTVNPANQISTAGYSYDGTGNLTADPTGTNSYNGAEQMTSVTRAGGTYAYTYAGTSQNEVLSETTPTHGSYQLVYGRTDQQGQPVVEQVNFNGSTGYVEHDPITGQPLMLRTSNGIQTLYVSDGIGNPVALLTDYSTQSYAYKYDPYGAAVLTAGGGNGGTQQNPYLFKGGIQDRTTGWVHFGARWYNPTTGRWTQQDTLDTPLNPANANRYAFAGDDPINNLDPTGQGCGLDWFLTGVALVGLAVSVFSGPGVLAGIGLAAGLIGTGGGAISILADGCI